MKSRFEKIYKELSENEQTIVNDFIIIQGKPVDIGGYYLPDDKRAITVMWQSEFFKKKIDEIGSEK